MRYHVSSCLEEENPKKRRGSVKENKRGDLTLVIQPQPHSLGAPSRLLTVLSVFFAMAASHDAKFALLLFKG